MVACLGDGVRREDFGLTQMVAEESGRVSGVRGMFGQDVYLSNDTRIENWETWHWCKGDKKGKTPRRNAELDVENNVTQGIQIAGTP